MKIIEMPMLRKSYFCATNQSVCCYIKKITANLRIMRTKLICEVREVRGQNKYSK